MPDTEYDPARSAGVQIKAEDVGSGEHAWLAPGEHPNTSKWTCCAACGVVQRADGRPQSPCRGVVKVALR